MPPHSPNINPEIWSIYIEALTVIYFLKNNKPVGQSGRPKYMCRQSNHWLGHFWDSAPLPVHKAVMPV